MAEVLSIDALIERKQIKIRSKLHPEGMLYDLRNPEEMGLVGYQAALAKLLSLQRLEAGGAELTAADAERTAADLDALLGDITIGIEPEVLADLGMFPKMAIVQSWAGLVSEYNKAVSAEGEVIAPPTGAESSPASSTSTEETPLVGLTSPSA